MSSDFEISRQTLGPDDFVVVKTRVTLPRARQDEILADLRKFFREAAGRDVHMVVLSEAIDISIVSPTGDQS
jgi:hypothetical protein